MNTDWHRHHKLPASASLDERVRWHIIHAAACGCRPIPKPVLAELRRRRRKPDPARKAR